MTLTGVKPVRDMDQLIHDLQHPLWWLELLGLLLCLTLAWWVSRRMALAMSGHTRWTGRSVTKGFVFPFLALALVFGLRALAVAHGPTPLLSLALPVLLSLVVLRMLVRLLSGLFPHSRGVQWVERSVSWLVWFALVMWFTGLDKPLLHELEAIELVFGKNKLSLLTLFQGVAYTGLVLMVTLWLSGMLERALIAPAVSDLSVRKMAGNVLRAVLMFLGLIIALSAIGVDLTALSVLGGALGVGLGFGLQNLAANYVSGFVILFERSLRIGDNIVLHQFEGQVVDITTRYTLIRGANGQDAVVPNQDLTTEMVLKQRRDVQLPYADGLILSSHWSVKHDSDVGLVQAALVQAALSVERVIPDPSPQAQLREVTPTGLHFVLVYWIKDPMVSQLSVRSEVNLAVVQALRDKGVGLAVAALEWRQPA
jgi:small-conductance mechanosensitive channel